MKKFFYLVPTVLFFLLSVGVAVPTRAHANDLNGWIAKLQAAQGEHAKLREAVDGLVLLGTSSVPALVELLNSSDDASVRTDTLFALGNIGGEEALQAILQRLQDKSGLVRHYAGYVLWEGDFDLSKIAETTLLDAAFEVFFHSEFLATLAGFKPVSVVNGLKPKVFEKLMKTAVEKHLITNTDIGWFFRTDETAKVVHFYSKKALAKLLENADLVSTLEQNGFPKVTSVDEAITKFDAFWHGKIPVPQENFDIISGIFFGYPKEEVLAYAKSREGGKQASGYNKNIFPEFGRENFFGWVVVSTEKSIEDLQQMSEKAKAATGLYHAAVKNGFTGLEIVNRWEPLPCTLPLKE